MTGKEVVKYVKELQALNREERAAWTDAWKFYAKEKKSAVAIRIAEMQAEAGEKKIADDLLAEEKKRADVIGCVTGLNQLNEIKLHFFHYIYINFMGGMP